jgi:hypothetical protein
VALLGQDAWSDIAAIAEDGSFEFSGVLPGAYRLRVESGSGLTATTGQTVIVSDRDITGVQLLPDPTGEISYRVTGTAGFPVPMLPLRLVPTTTPQTAQLVQGQPDASGRVPVVRVRPTDYTVTTPAIPTNYVLRSLTAEGRDLRTETLRVPPFSRIEITAILEARDTQLRKVSGRLVDPPEGSSVLLQGSGFVMEAAIGSNGSFEFTGIPNGRYLLLRRHSPGAAPVSPLIAIEVAGDVRVPDLVMPSTRKVSGRVTVDGDAPTPRVTLLFASASPPAAPVALALQLNTGAGAPIRVAAQPTGYTVFARGNGAAGSFEAPLSDAEYTVRLQSVPLGYRLKSIMAGGADRINTPLKIDADFRGEVVVTLEALAPIPWTRVNGRITAGLATPAPPGMKIALVGRTNDGWETTIGADGAFEFARVVPGVYTAMLLPLENPMRTQRVTVTADNAANLQIAFGPRRELRGKVAVEGDGPAPNLRLQLDLLHSGLPNPLGTPTPAMVIKPGADGRFSVTAAEGVYFISVTGIPPEYQLRSVTAGGKDLLRVPLQLSEAQDDMVLTLVRTTKSP